MLNMIYTDDHFINISLDFGMFVAEEDNPVIL